MCTLCLDDVTLEQGKNTIKTVATYNGKEYTDEIEWNYTGERSEVPIGVKTKKSTQVGNRRRFCM